MRSACDAEGLHVHGNSRVNLNVLSKVRFPKCVVYSMRSDEAAGFDYFWAASEGEL